MKTETQPYEFLVRFRNGTLAGSQIQFIEVTKNDEGKVIAEKLGNTMAVGSAGFPLADFLSDLHIASLATIEDLKREKAEMQVIHDATVTEEKAKAEQEKAQAVEDERVKHTATIATLTAEIHERDKPERQRKIEELEKQKLSCDAQIAELSK